MSELCHAARRHAQLRLEICSAFHIGMQIRNARIEDNPVPQKRSWTAGSVAPRDDGNGQATSSEGEGPSHPSCNRSARDGGLRDRTDHLPRFERCFIGLFTASSMIVAGEGEAMEARRNHSP